MSLNPWSEAPALKTRFLFLSLAAVAVFLLLALRLWTLQVINGERYLSLSEKNRIRYVPIAAPRGPVFDRNGELLVDIRPSFRASVLRQDVEDRDLLLDRLSAILPVSREDLLKRWQEGSRFPPYRPLPLADDIGRDALEQIQENSVDLPGVLTEVRPLRAYPYGELGAHLFGYLGEITERELQAEAFSGYRAGNYVGKSGLEKHLEAYLRGGEGERRLEVDVKGKELRILKTQEPSPGNKVYLTLRQDVQMAAEEGLGDGAGAVVALDVHSGEVLALVSRPAFDPALFARGIAGKEWIELVQNSRHPLQNKALRGQYPPGSTFKIVTALAALRAGVASPATTFNCTGSFELGDAVYRCWKKRGHGATDLKKALRESCDVWFYQVGLELGIDRLAQMARELGLGAPLDFPLEGEKGGLIPDREWKKRRFNTSWYPGETVIASIGQGYVLATPLQLAVMTAAVANGGTVLRPQVVKRVEDFAGNVLLESAPEAIRSQALEPAHLRAVRLGLEAVVNESRGTGAASRLDSIRVAGKTGTAQVVRRKSDEEEALEAEDVTPYRFRDHALFVAYAPAEDPKIAVAVVVEHGGHGGSAAAPVARRVFESYFGIEAAETAAVVALGDE
ncbi:MAG: penicillin-binding protein 2 [Desulfuromonas sp.]|uniref:penicillin-binding protein 2 n=1 Tax=Desulfuromonas sp. TaxID=892 RepID=UPI000CC9EFF3|nr:penicillin-binding protein 2 [Desulfuromonas sp.]PLX81828.1 MAG: penicillin-binding protein 2 [Desulfuromonas sp.]